MNIGVKCRFFGVTGREVSMKIALCDDEAIFLEEIKSKIYEYANSYNWEPVIDLFYSGEALLATKEKFDLIILDYQMGGISGLETAEKIRCGINRFASIIFLTSYPEIAIPAYDVDTYRFVVKNTLYSGLFKALDDFRSIHHIDYDIVIKSDGELITLNTSEIVFIESHNKDIYVHCSNEKIFCTKTKLTELYQRIPHSHFYKCHKSYIVNFQFIKHRNGNDIYIKGSPSPIPVSRNYKNEFNIKYNNYLKEQ